MEPQSAARPAELARYARVVNSAGARLEAESRRLEVALGSFSSGCREYSVPAASGLATRLATYARHEAELAARVDQIARAFLAADMGALTPTAAELGHLPVAPVDEAERLNAEAHRMLVLLQILCKLIEIHGLDKVLRTKGFPVFGGPGIEEADLQEILHYAPTDLVSIWPRRPITLRESYIEELIQTYWHEGRSRIDPERFRELCAELDRLNTLVAEQQGLSPGTPRSPQQIEQIIDSKTGLLDVSASQAFPLSAPQGESRDLPFAPGPADAFVGHHSGISYFSGEQVRLERLNGATGDYRISIAGLNLHAPAANNNLEALALTAQGVRDGNRYYEEVRARLVGDLGRLPPGSRLHLEGHGVGGGICLLLRVDPEVQRRLLEAGVAVGSIITFGAIRPQGPAAQPDVESASPFFDATERNYVDQADSFARTIGAGHTGDPTVIVVGNGREAATDPDRLHYGDEQVYADLPDELRTMPYTVDPPTYAVYSNAGETTPLRPNAH